MQKELTSACSLQSPPQILPDSQCHFHLHQCPGTSWHRFKHSLVWPCLVATSPACLCFEFKDCAERLGERARRNVAMLQILRGFISMSVLIYIYIYIFDLYKHNTPMVRRIGWTTSPALLVFDSVWPCAYCLLHSQWQRCLDNKELRSEDTQLRSTHDRRHIRNGFCDRRKHWVDECCRARTWIHYIGRQQVMFRDRGSPFNGPQPAVAGLSMASLYFIWLCPNAFHSFFPT